MSGNVTIKAGKDFDCPWIVAEAPNDIAPDQQVAHQRAYILAAFGMSPEDPEIVNLSLAEIVAQASGHFQGVWAAARGLGATPVRADLGGAPKAARTPAKGRAAAPKAKSSEEPVNPLGSTVGPGEEGPTRLEVSGAPEEDRPEPEAHPFQEVLDEIAGATSKKALQAIFHGSKEAMADASVLDALKARTKAVAA